MPAGGSKKGECRGHVMREAKRRGAPHGNNNNPNGRPKGGMNRATRERITQLGQELGISELSGLMPRQCLLEIMRIFMKMGMSECEEMAAKQTEMVTLLAAEDIDGGKVRECSDRISVLSSAFERHMVLAADIGSKAAPYWNPRLQALAIAGAGGDQSPGDVLRAMLDEIDGEARVERQGNLQEKLAGSIKQIDHVPVVLDGILNDDDEEAA